MTQNDEQWTAVQLEQARLMRRYDSVRRRKDAIFHGSLAASAVLGCYRFFESGNWLWLALGLPGAAYAVILGLFLLFSLGMRRAQLM